MIVTTAAEALVQDVLESVSANYSVEENAEMLENVISARSLNYLVNDGDNGAAGGDDDEEQLVPSGRDDDNDENDNIHEWLNGIAAVSSRNNLRGASSTVATTGLATTAARRLILSQQQQQQQALPTPKPTPRQPSSTPFSIRAPLGTLSVNTSNIKANTGTATKLKQMMKEKDAEIFKLRSQLATLNVEGSNNNKENG